MSGPNDSISVEQWMLLALANSILDQLVTRQYDQLEAEIEAVGGSLGVTQDQYGRYQITALKTRDRKVLGGRWRSLGYAPFDMDVSEPWAITTAMHSVLSSVGEVRFGDSGPRIYPLWDTGADDLVLNRDERDMVTRKLRAAYQQCGIKYENAISADREGHQKVMILAYLPEEGKWVAGEPFSLQDATAHACLGITPVTQVTSGRVGPDYMAVDMDALATHLAQVPFWVPNMQFKRRTVMQYLQDFADLRR